MILGDEGVMREVIGGQHTLWKQGSKTDIWIGEEVWCFRIKYFEFMSSNDVPNLTWTESKNSGN